MVADSAYSSTKGLNPYIAVEAALEVNVWSKLTLSTGLGVYSTFLSSKQRNEGPPLSGRFGARWRL